MVSLGNNELMATFPVLDRREAGCHWIGRSTEHRVNRKCNAEAELTGIYDCPGAHDICRENIASGYVCC